MRRLLLLVLLYLITTALVVPCTAQIHLNITPNWDNYGIDLDNHPYILPPPDMVIASYDFEGCSPDGWTTHDLTGGGGPFFHVDDFPGMAPPYGPLAGTQSLWCGARASRLEPTCSYATLPGYGDYWEQRWTTKTCFPVTGTVTVAFKAQWDSEMGYDYTDVEYDNCDGTWTPVNGNIGTPEIWGTGGPTTAAFSFSHTGNVHVRLRFHSDSEWSDQDGRYDSNGAIIVDNLRVDDDNGVVVAEEDFEGEASGATESNDWIASSGSFGDYAGLVLGSTQDQGDPYFSDITCLWSFAQGPVNNYSCGHPTLPAVPMGPIEYQYMLNEIWSPPISFVGPTTYGTHLHYDAYLELPLDDLVVAQWKVRELLIGDTCWGPWKNNNFVYQSDDPVWFHEDFDLTPYLSAPSTISEIQVALGVRDMARYWTGTIGTGTCHTHAPLIDNVSVHRTGLASVVLISGSLPQDRFPTDGTLTGTVRIDGPVSDAMRLKIADARAPIDFLTPGDSTSGPAVFLFVKNLPNKSGSVISGGSQWPYVKSLSDQTWTAIQMSQGPDENEYDVDLNDQLYQPGDVVEYFVAARNANGDFIYWSNFTGVADAATVMSHLMEVTCLPTPPQQGVHRALYVDGYSGLGAQPLIENSMSNLGLQWDRFDRNDPLQRFPNSLGDLITNPDFLQYYDLILWNTGDLSNPFGSADFGLMAQYLDSTQNAKLFLSGSQAARALAKSSDPAADYIRTNFMSFNLVTDDHRSLGLPLTPLVTGVAQGLFPGQFYVSADKGTSGKSDVIQAAGSSQLGMYYGSSQNDGALLYEDGVGNAGPVKMVLAGFSLHSVRDDAPSIVAGNVQAASAVPDRTVLLDQVLQYFGTPANTPTGIKPSRGDFLAQNEPNPFNPTTIIRYSLATAEPVSLRIYDVDGTLIRTLVDDAREAAGPNQVVWNGRDDHGVQVASGVYFYHIATPQFQATKKLVLLK